MEQMGWSSWNQQGGVPGNYGQSVVPPLPTGKPPEPPLPPDNPPPPPPEDEQGSSKQWQGGPPSGAWSGNYNWNQQPSGGFPGNWDSGNDWNASYRGPPGNTWPGADPNANWNQYQGRQDAQPNMANQNPETTFDESKDAELVEFDNQFKTWEDKFLTWKEENKDHPDKAALKTYEDQWTKWRDELLQKRTEIKKNKLEALKGSQTNTNFGQPWQSTGVAPPSNSNQQPNRENAGSWNQPTSNWNQSNNTWGAPPIGNQEQGYNQSNWSGPQQEQGEKDGREGYESNQGNIQNTNYAGQAFGPNQGGPGFGPNQGGPGFGPNQGGPGFGPNQGGPGFGPNQGGPGFGPNQGGPGFGPNQGGPGFGPNQGGPGFGPNQGGPGFGPNQGGPGFGPNQGGPGFGPNQGGSAFGPNQGGSGFDLNQGGPGFGTNQGGSGFGPNQGGPGFGPNRGGPGFGPNRGGPGYGPNRGGPRFGPNRGGPRFGPNQGGPRYGPNQGGPEYGPNQGSPGYGPNQGGPGFGPNEDQSGSNQDRPGVRYNQSTPGPNQGSQSGVGFEPPTQSGQGGPSFGPPSRNSRDGPGFGPNHRGQGGPDFGPNRSGSDRNSSGQGVPGFGPRRGGRGFKGGHGSPGFGRNGEFESTGGSDFVQSRDSEFESDKKDFSDNQRQDSNYSSPAPSDSWNNRQKSDFPERNQNTGNWPSNKLWNKWSGPPNESGPGNQEFGTNQRQQGFGPIKDQKKFDRGEGSPNMGFKPSYEDDIDVNKDGPGFGPNSNQTPGFRGRGRGRVSNLGMCSDSNDPPSRWNTGPNQSQPWGRGNADPAFQREGPPGGWNEGRNQGPGWNNNPDEGPNYPPTGFAKDSNPNWNSGPGYGDSDRSSFPRGRDRGRGGRGRGRGGAFPINQGEEPSSWAAFGTIDLEQEEKKSKRKSRSKWDSPPVKESLESVYQPANEPEVKKEVSNPVEAENESDGEESNLSFQAKSRATGNILALFKQRAGDNPGSIPGLDLPSKDESIAKKPSVSPSPKKDVIPKVKSEDMSKIKSQGKLNIGPIGVKPLDSGWKPPHDWYDDEDDNEKDTRRGGGRSGKKKRGNSSFEGPAMKMLRGEMSNDQPPSLFSITCEPPFPGEPGGPSGPGGPDGSGGPVGSHGQGGPVGSHGPGGPGGSLGPGGPGGSFGPGGPGGSFGPGGPGASFGPGGPGGSFGPGGPGESFGPGGPGESFGPRGPGRAFGPRGPGRSFGPRGRGGSFGPGRPSGPGGLLGDAPRFIGDGPRGMQSASGGPGPGMMGPQSGGPDSFFGLGPDCGPGPSRAIGGGPRDWESKQGNYRDRGSYLDERSSKRTSPPDSYSKRRDKNNHRMDFGNENRGDGYQKDVYITSEVNSKIEIQKDSPPDPEVVTIDDLISVPGRFMRPPRLVIILRGLPGSGKSTMAKMIKDKEIENGGSAPRILCLDDYFMVEVEKMVTDRESGRKVKTKVMEYDYEPELEDKYRSALIKSFKKQVDEKFFPFIIIDCVNSQYRHYKEICEVAKKNDFEPYIGELDVDVQTCFQRNCHNRNLAAIKKLHSKWEETPIKFIKLDLTSYMQDADIQEVEMEDCSGAADDNNDVDKSGKEMGTEEEDDDENLETFKIIKELSKSKWDTIETQGERLDKLDGVRSAKKRMSESHKPQSIEDWLQLSKDYDKRTDIPGKKRVRWADMEEKKRQMSARDRGFVLGQTDWQRMTDPTMGSNALVQVHYIEPRNFSYD